MVENLFLETLVKMLKVSVSTVKTQAINSELRKLILNYLLSDYQTKRLANKYTKEA